MISGIVSFILNADKMDSETFASMSVTTWNKTAVLLKIHKNVKSNSAPYCYVLISKSNRKLSFSLEHVGKRGDLKRKKIQLSNNLCRSMAV